MKNQSDQNETEIDCQKCNAEFNFEKSNGLNKEAFYKKPMTLLDFMEHEVVHEYEKAKRAIFNKDLTLK